MAEMTAAFIVLTVPIGFSFSIESSKRFAHGQIATGTSSSPRGTLFSLQKIRPQQVRGIPVLVDFDLPIREIDFQTDVDIETGRPQPEVQPPADEFNHEVFASMSVNMDKFKDIPIVRREPVTSRREA
jgi:hypothetical protein